LPNYIVNLIGDGVQYWVAELEETAFEKITKIMVSDKLSLPEVIFDLDILNQLGFESWTSIPFQSETIALETSSESKVEIKKRKKRLLNIKSRELIDNHALFPLYNLVEESNCKKEIESTSRTILFGHQITGTICSFTLSTDKLYMDDLKFIMITNPNKRNRFLLKSIRHRDLELKPRSPSFLIRGFFAKFID
jgi:hypothetical protein